MSASHVSHYSHADSHGGLLANLVAPLRAIANALLAAQPVAKPVAVEAVAVKKADRKELFRLARSYEDVSPNLAAELRFIGRQ